MDTSRSRHAHSSNPCGVANLPRNGHLSPELEMKPAGTHLAISIRTVRVVSITDALLDAKYTSRCLKRGATKDADTSWV